MSIFKAYDIRGIYGSELTEAVAHNIGRAFITFLGAKTVVVGRDIRSHSSSLTNALVDGMTKQGADVIDIGVCSTPMNYFANGYLKTDASIMVTASHNPSEWNGFKLCRQSAIPISGDTGIKEVGRLAEAGVFASSSRVGARTTRDIAAEYHRMIRGFATFRKKPKIVVDYANAMGIAEMSGLKDLFDIVPLYDQYDGRFPNHEANPLKSETLHALQEEVQRSKASFGVAFDGDADRCGFVDEHGEIITMDLTTAMIAKEILSRGPATILYDLRSSRMVREHIEANGGKAIMCRVGHAFIKNQMRDCNAVFAGELAGHFYFQENYVAESSGLALLMVANAIEKSGKPLSEIVRPLRKYYSTGEINSEARNTKAILDAIKQRYSHGRIFTLDGVSVEFDDWWFNVRPSNTEPLIRLILEAMTPDIMAQRRDEIFALIKECNR